MDAHQGRRTRALSQSPIQMIDKVRERTIVDNIDLATGIKGQYLGPNTNKNVFVLINGTAQ
eukprot:scaffold217900_cov55-Attheya_sp.AAC.2